MSASFTHLLHIMVFKQVELNSTCKILTVSSYRNMNITMSIYNNHKKNELEKHSGGSGLYLCCPSLENCFFIFTKVPHLMTFDDVLLGGHFEKVRRSCALQFVQPPIKSLVKHIRTSVIDSIVFSETRFGFFVCWILLIKASC